MRLTVIALCVLGIQIALFGATNQLKRIADLLEAEAIRVHQVTHP